MFLKVSLEVLKVSENTWRTIISKELCFGRIKSQNVKLKEVILDLNGMKRGETEDDIFII